jgi:hypothetical protein
MEPKDYLDLNVKDSQWLRQMSIQNAQMALQQAKLEYQSHSIDLQNMYDTLSRRINGGNGYNSVLDRLKDEFQNYSILTIENVETLIGTSVHYKGIEWNILNVETTSTTYNFLIVREYLIGSNEEIKMVLSRVPMGGESKKIYALQNDTNGRWVGIGKELLRDKNEFLKQMVGLTDAQN